MLQINLFLVDIARYYTFGMCGHIIDKDNFLYLVCIYKSTIVIFTYRYFYFSIYSFE